MVFNFSDMFKNDVAFRTLENFTISAGSLDSFPFFDFFLYESELQNKHNHSLAIYKENIDIKPAIPFIYSFIYDVINWPVYSLGPSKIFLGKLHHAVLAVL